MFWAYTFVENYLFGLKQFRKQQKILNEVTLSDTAPKTARHPPLPCHSEMASLHISFQKPFAISSPNWAARTKSKPYSGSSYKPFIGEIHDASVIFVDKYTDLETLIYTSSSNQTQPISQWSVILQGRNIYFYVLYYLPKSKKRIIFLSDAFPKSPKSVHNSLPLLLGLTWGHPISQSVLPEKHLGGGGREEGEADLGVICLWYCDNSA